MRRNILALLLPVFFGMMVFGICGSARATLIEDEPGIITQTRNDGSVLMWLENANYGAGSIYDNGLNSTDGRMTWDNAVLWAENLVFGGYDDWRLPSAFNQDGSGPDFTYNVTSEMGYMYYTELGNSAGLGLSLSNTGPFENLQPDLYWSGTECLSPNFDGLVWSFLFYNGLQTEARPGYDGGYAWAVRSAPVPEPATALLLVFGLLGLMGLKKFGQRH